MSKTIKKNYWDFRPLLTETLPYELPVIFSNDRFYFLKCRKEDPLIRPLLQKLHDFRVSSTVPYNYEIRKDQKRTTVLSIVHPLVQLEWCDLYTKYESTMLTTCARSSFSLRYPSAVAAVYVANLDTDRARALKTGQVHLEPDGSEPEIEKPVSYFAYKRFNLINKFYESREFLDLERKYHLLRQLDVSKCFYNIYTHSIAWAIRGKEFSKQNIGTHSFEQRFDSLIQKSNHNETNGIVVGPELSRIFAECIFQDIDNSIKANLAEQGISEGRDYAVRRYVDDFSLFANSEHTLNCIEKAARTELAKYKLHINESKIRDHRRPFISKLSQARSQIKARFQEIREITASPNWKAGESLTIEQRRSMRALVHGIRTIVSTHDIDFSSVGGYVIGEIRTLISIASTNLTDQTEQRIQNWLECVMALLQSAFYIVSVDTRVRTTYSICQVLIAVKRSAKKVAASVFESIVHFCTHEVSKCIEHIIQTSHSQDVDSVEAYNLLIAGTLLDARLFLENAEVKQAISHLLPGKMSYFKYVCLKYCLLKDKPNFPSELSAINTGAQQLLQESDGPFRVRSESELYLLLCDYISAPDLDAHEKLAMFKRFFGGNHSTDAIKRLGQVIGFTDWDGISIEHTLRRRQLRPVYAMS